MHALYAIQVLSFKNLKAFWKLCLYLHVHRHEMASAHLSICQQLVEAASCNTEVEKQAESLAKRYVGHRGPLCLKPGRDQKYL